MKFSKARRLSGELTIPGDKSISHRSIMFGSIAEGLTEVRGFLQGADCLSTISCFTKMGIPIENKGNCPDSRQGAARAYRPERDPGLRQQRHHDTADLRNPGSPGFRCNPDRG